MVCKVYSSTPNGIYGQKIIVETCISNALPTIKIVGLPDRAVEDAKERVIPAIKNSGIPLIPKKITVNLAPSFIPKTGISLDLPIAISIIGSYGYIDTSNLDKILFIGELSLNGDIRYTNGILQALDVMDRENFNITIIPEANKYDLAQTKEYSGKIFTSSSLYEIIKYLNNSKVLSSFEFQPRETKSRDLDIINNLRGNSTIKRVLPICAAGRHHILMTGSPGTGKTTAARIINELLPDMTNEEAYETSLIYSISQPFIPENILQKRPPFRSPHHTSSNISIIGGGTTPNPGEISLANNGILFLDEFAEFDRKTLDSLREPMEEGFITISRTKYKITYPSRFMLVAATNPCPCGYYMDPLKHCTCFPSDINRYNKKISKVITDRIDINLYVKRPTITDLNTLNNCNDTRIIEININNAYKMQNERYKNCNYKYNSQITMNDIPKYCQLTYKAEKVIKSAYEKLSLSPRGYLKILRIARTIADLECQNVIDINNITEAISYRTENETKVSSL